MRISQKPLQKFMEGDNEKITDNLIYDNEDFYIGKEEF
jgi:hypothetical protein